MNKSYIFFFLEHLPVVESPCRDEAVEETIRVASETIRPLPKLSLRQVRIAGVNLKGDAPGAVHPTEGTGQPERAHPADHGCCSNPHTEPIEGRQYVGGTTRYADQAEFVELESICDVLHVMDGVEGTPSFRELRFADSGPVRCDDSQSLLLRLSGDVRGLVMRTDEAMEEDGRMPSGIPVFRDLQRPPAP